MISTINGSGYNQSFSVMNHGARSNFQRHERDNNPSAFSLSYEQDRLDGYVGMWTNGSGTEITSGGTVLFEASGNGGALSTLVLANRGATTLYYGLNDNNIAVASGTPLQSGESIQFVDNIYALWAMTASGTTVLTANGIFKQNPNTV